MKIIDLTRCFEQTDKPIIIICDIKNANKMIDELMTRTPNGPKYEFTNKKIDEGFNFKSIFVEGKTFHFIDEKDSKKFFKKMAK